MIDVFEETDPSKCLHCGAHVTELFRRVSGDSDDRAHRCNECDSYRRISRGSAAGVDVPIVDHQNTDRDGCRPTLLADGRGQTTAGWVVLVAVLVLLTALPLLLVVVG